MSDTPLSDKSYSSALLLCYFLGIFGAHRFYVGKAGTAVLMLLTGGGVGIWAIIDFVRIVVGSFEDCYGQLLRPAVS